MSSSSVPMVTPPSASQEEALFEQVLQAAEQAVPEMPKNASILPLFMPAYNMAKGKVEKEALFTFNTQNTCKFHFKF